MKQGRIPVDASGRIDPAKADAAIAATRSAVPSLPSNGNAAGDPSLPSLIQARTVHETYKAKREKLEYERLAGKLVETDRVLEAAEKAFSTVRVRLRGLPKSLAPLLAATNRAANVERILSESIDSALEALSTKPFEVTTDGR